jgi:hypothetical protein
MVASSLLPGGPRRYPRVALANLLFVGHRAMVACCQEEVSMVKTRRQLKQ